MFQVKRLSAVDAADPERLKEFIDGLNAAEEECFQAGVLCAGDLNVAPTGDLFAVQKFAVADLQRGGQMRPALASEVKKKLDSLRRERALSGQRHEPRA